MTATTDRILSTLAGVRVEAIDALRAAAGSPADFDAALLALADAGRVQLCRDCDPLSVPPVRAAQLLREGRHLYTTAMLLR